MQILWLFAHNFSHVYTHYLFNILLCIEVYVYVCVYGERDDAIQASIRDVVTYAECLSFHSCVGFSDVRNVRL